MRIHPSALPVPCPGCTLCYWPKGCSRNYPRGGGSQALFCPVGGGCSVDNVSEEWGVGVTCPGGQGIFDP